MTQNQFVLTDDTEQCEVGSSRVWMSKERRASVAQTTSAVNGIMGWNHRYICFYALCSKSDGMRPVSRGQTVFLLNSLLLQLLLERSVFEDTNTVCGAPSITSQPRPKLLGADHQGQLVCDYFPGSGLKTSKVSFATERRKQARS